MMKALVATQYGGPELLSIEDVPIPRPGPGQLLVRVAASTINATDLQVITGVYRDVLELEFPYVLGNDFAGTVTEVGRDVTGFVVGDEVFGQAMPRPLRVVAAADRPSISTGAMAEYVVIEADTPLVAHRPSSVSVQQAAALGIAGLTARAILATTQVQPGESVLVIGATGGVGTSLVPLLATAGAHITATAGTPADGEVLRGLGAHEVIGFSATEYPDDVDVVVNLVFPGHRLAPVARAIRPGGRLTTIIFPAPSPDDLGRDDVVLQYVSDLECRLGDMADVARAAAAGALTATVGRTLRLSDGVEAAVSFSRQEVVGKIVVTM